MDATFGQEYQPADWMTSESYTAPATQGPSLAQTIITGLADITKSITGVVAASKAAEAAAPQPGQPGVQPVYLSPGGMSAAQVAMIGIPVALLGVLLLSRR